MLRATKTFTSAVTPGYNSEIIDESKINTVHEIHGNQAAPS